MTSRMKCASKMLRFGIPPSRFSALVVAVHFSSNSQPRQSGLRSHSTRRGGNESTLGSVLKRNIFRGGRSKEGGGEICPDESSGLIPSGGENQNDAKSEGTRGGPPGRGSKS